MEGFSGKMNDFLSQNNWFEEKYAKKCGDRMVTFKAALNLFYQRRGKVIVETGTVRAKNDWGAGMSTLLFADFLYKEAPVSKLYTIDISEDNIQMSKEITKEFADKIHYQTSDSVEYLRGMKAQIKSESSLGLLPIDMLYLDSLDFPLSQEEGDPKEAREHQLNEYLAARDKLSPNAIVLLDDNQVMLKNGEQVEGKTTHTKEQLIQDGWEMIMDRQQSLWQRARKS